MAQVKSRICNKCNVEKLLINFCQNKNGKYGRYSICSSCRSDRRVSNVNYHKKYYRNVTWWRHLENTYNLTKEAYSYLLKSQKNRCAICRTKLDTYHKQVANGAAVDHCHRTDRVRGLLCNHCNRGLGMFKDNIELLKNAIKYLRKHAK